MVNSVSNVRLLEGPRPLRQRASATTAAKPSFNQELRPVAAVFGCAFRQQSSLFLAQLLAAETPYQGVERDETASSIALYVQAARTVAAAYDAVDLKV